MTVSGLYDILINELTAWLEGAVAALPNLAIAVGIVVAFVILSRIAARVTRELVGRYSSVKTLTSLATACVTYGVLAAGLFIALGVLGLQKTVFSLLAGAGVIGLAIGFAFQDLVANLLAGIYLAVRHPFRVGHVIKSGDLIGKVARLTLRNTEIETFSGELVLIPNKQVFENPLINYHGTGQRRVDIAVGVGYETDLEKACNAAREAIRELDVIDQEKGVDVLLGEFGGSSIDMTVRFWIDYPGQKGYLEARHEGIKKIKKAFDEHGIEIPFPIRTLDFGMTKKQSAELKIAVSDDASSLLREVAG